MLDTQITNAGAAREVITPPRGTYLIGYAGRWRGCSGVHDDLYATALAITDGARTVAVVACDLLCIHEDVVDRVRRGVPAGVEVVVCCSHTHAGPIVHAGDRATSGRRAYLSSLVEAIVRSVTRAVEQCAPANLSWAAAGAGIGVNRRERAPDGKTVIGWNRGGPADRTVGILRITRPGGEPVATVVNHACHGTILPPENLLVSSEWPGVMRSCVEKELGGLALFIQGAAANINPDYEWGIGDPWEAVGRLGAQVGNAVVAAVGAGCKPIAGTPIGIARQEVVLPLEASACTPTPPADYRKKVLEFAGLPRWLSPATDLLLAWRYPWRSRVTAHGGRWAVPMRVNAVRFGDVSLVTFGAEVFTEIGIQVKAASPAPCAMFASLADGCIGYLPTAAAHDEGGYEVDEAPYLYRYPARLARECEALAVDAARDAYRRMY